MFGKTAIRKGDWKMIQEPEDDYFSCHEEPDQDSSGVIMALNGK